MERLKVMISSVVGGMEGERDAIQKLFSVDRFPFVELIGATPYLKKSVPASSSVATVKMAMDCGLYVLILGEKYGMETKEGKSATEVEFDAAYRTDPTKILVFLREKEGVTVEERQAEFIARVSDYYNGYFRTSFQYSHELSKYVETAFWEWLINRAQIGPEQTCVDHFIRLAKETVPVRDVKLYYRTYEDHFEIDAIYGDKKISHHVTNSELLTNFWQNIHFLREAIRGLLES